MKKGYLFILLMIILCLIPLFSAMAQTGTVTVEALNIRASASSDSNVVGVYHEALAAGDDLAALAVTLCDVRLMDVEVRVVILHEAGVGVRQSVNMHILHSRHLHVSVLVQYLSDASVKFT